MAIVKALTREEKLDVLAAVTGKEEHEVEVLLDGLEARGFTIYNKKRHLRPHKPPTAQPVTATLQTDIHRLDAAGYSQQEIAAMLNVNIGRVSETLMGDY